MEVSGDPVLAPGERWKFRRTCSGLGRTGGGCGRYFCSRVTYYRTGEDTLRISVARVARSRKGIAGLGGCARVRAREGRAAHPSNPPLCWCSERERRREERKALPRLLFSFRRPRTHTRLCVRVRLRANTSTTWQSYTSARILPAP